MNKRAPMLIALAGLLATTAVAAAQQGPQTAWDAFYTHFPAATAPSRDQHLTDPILTGAIDLHAHFGPDAFQRQWDAFEIARMMQARGMRGAVFKNHFSESAGLAYLIRKYAAPHLEAFGGLALNAEVGGINPMAVRYFAAVEGKYAKIVWMPTHDAEHEVVYSRETRPFVAVAKNNVLLPAVLEVLDLIKQHDLTLATGHVTPSEMLLLVGEAKKRGIAHVIVTHPGLGPMFTDPSIDQLRQAVAMGAKIEVVATALQGKDRNGVIAMVKTLGVDHCFVSSDSGLVGTLNHPDALVTAIHILRKAGFSERALDTLFRKNPARLIGLSA